MPIWEFKCPECEQRFEFLAKDGEKKFCKDCEVELHKLVSAVAFKGQDGFYHTRMVVPTRRGKSDDTEKDQ